MVIKGIYRISINGQNSVHNRLPSVATAWHGLVSAWLSWLPTHIGGVAPKSLRKP